MSQVDVDTSIGYALKRATSALRAAMDECLRELDITVSQYSSLELLAHRPGLSNAELARAVFVSRQATHQLLAGLTREGLVEIEGVGRDQRLHLTSKGRERLRKASAAVAAVEHTMIAALSAQERESLHRNLVVCSESLGEHRQS